MQYGQIRKLRECEILKMTLGCQGVLVYQFAMTWKEHSSDTRSDVMETQVCVSKRKLIINVSVFTHRFLP